LGTIHVPYHKVWDSIPQIAKDSFNNCERIIFELDLLNGATHNQLSRCQLLPSGIKLSDIIPRELYRRLEEYLQYVKTELPHWLRKHYPGNDYNQADSLFKSKTDNWERKRPIWIMVMLNSLTENGVKSLLMPVLDVYLAHDARQHNKEIGSVEKVNFIGKITRLRWYNNTFCACRRETSAVH